MTAIEMLQTMKVHAEQLLAQLNSGASRLYEISTTGILVERTSQMRDYYQGLGQQLQQVLEALRGESAAGGC